MNCLSYSLFGNLPMYVQGALRNAEMAKEYYPGWQTVFYCETESVPPHIITELMERGAKVRMYSKQECPNGMFKRFEIADDPDVERFVIRDVDSRPCAREVNAVAAWIDSGLDFHVMRDHPYHAAQMMGGLWGAKASALPNMTKAVKSFHRYQTAYSREKAYGADQEFLASFVWPKVKRSGLIHDSFNASKLGGVPFPDGLKLGDWRFVGEIFDEKDEPEPTHWQMRINGMTRD